MSNEDTSYSAGAAAPEGQLQSDPRALALESQVRNAARSELARIGQLHRLDDVVAAALRRIGM